MELRQKQAFCLLGKEGSTKDGEGFVQKLWQSADANFSEIAPLIKKDSHGKPLGLWGAMTDFSRSFQPWEEFSRGLYLAGAECEPDAQAPSGWSKWEIPAFEFLVVPPGDGALEMGFEALREQGLSLAGAIQEYYPPDGNGAYELLFPVQAK